MSTIVTVTPTNHPSPGSPIQLDFTPTTAWWLEELIVYEVPSQTTPVIGTLDPTKAYATIFVDSDIFIALQGCLRDSSFTVTITYSASYAVTDFSSTGTP